MAPSGMRKIVGWCDDGVRDGWRVETWCGGVYECSGAHRFWVRSPDGTEGWKCADELSEQDYVAIARGRADFGSRVLDNEEAYALGLLIADGSLGDSRPKGTVSLRIDKQVPVLERVAPTIRKWQLATKPYVNARTSIRPTNPRHAVLVAGSVRWPEFLLSNFGLHLGYSETRSVPTAVLEGNRDTVRFFLKGYFDGDGWCDTSAKVSTASRLLAEQVRALLLGLGVACRLKVKATTKLPAHVIEVNDTITFAKEVGFTPYGLTKDKNFAAVLVSAGNTNVDTVPYLGEVIREAARSVIAYRHHVASVRNISAYYADRRPSRTVLGEWLAWLPDSPALRELRRVYDDDYFWSRVVSKRQSAVGRIDCEVEGDHAYISNGAVSHNTMIFQLPAVMRRDRPVLVISPLIALMRSQVQRALKEGIPAAALTSQYTPRQQREVIDQIPNLSLLYVAPERFEDSRFLDAIRRTPPWLVAIDESHSVSDWGLSFRPAYRFARDMLVQSGLDEGLQWLALTASATEEVVADLRQQYGMQDAKLYRFSCDRPNLDYVVERCVRGMKMVKIQRLVESSLSDGGCAIVYTQSRREAEELAEWFRKSNPRRPCKHYHAGIGKPQRAEVERLFFDKEIDVVFSTCAFGMGIDRSDVRLVVMHGMPKSIEDFYQMAGRAGRDGERCKAVALYAGDDDYKKREWLIKNGHDLENNRFKENYGMHDPKFAQAIDQQLRLLKQLDWFMRSRECRAVLLRRYFGEKDGVACGRCDACKFSMGGRP